MSTSPSFYRQQWFTDGASVRREILAGIVVALALIPEAIGFSIIAGVDPRVGLYASVTIAIVIAFTGGICRPTSSAPDRGARCCPLHFSRIKWWYAGSGGSTARLCAQHALRVAMDDALRVPRMTMPQYIVLSSVEAESGISNARLARAAFVTAQTVQEVLANLEYDGLLERDADPHHDRILRSELPGEVRRLLADAHEVRLCQGGRSPSERSCAECCAMGGGQ